MKDALVGELKGDAVVVLFVGPAVGEAVVSELEGDAAVGPICQPGGGRGGGGQSCLCWPGGERGGGGGAKGDAVVGPFVGPPVGKAVVGKLKGDAVEWLNTC